MGVAAPPDREERRAKRWAQVKAFLKSFKPFLWPVVIGLFLLLPLAIPLVSADPTWEQRSVKFSGVLLQFAGLWSVVLGLSRSREMFGERGLWRWFRLMWTLFSRIFRLPREHYVEMDLTLPALIASGHATMSKAERGHTLEDRVTTLEKELERVSSQIDEIKRSVSEAKNKQTETIRNETKERRRGDREIRSQMKEAVIGGIHLEAAGVAYIALGIVLTTFPNGIASLLY